MATIYRIRFNNVEEQAVECTLTDETGDLDIIDIEGAEDAIRIVSQDNDESKYSPIKAKKCVIKFLNSQSVNVRTFSTGEDNRWLVDVKINSLIVFVGHLEQGDIEEPFQYELNQIVTLTATDGLGVLKTHRLEDIYNVWTTSGGCGANENRIIDYIAACLGASGLSLTINVINNLREIDNPATDPVTLGNIYAALYLDIKTWEDQKVGQYTNCYDVLEKILGHDCYLTQAKGMWWIIRVTELRQDFNMNKTIFDFNGTLLSAETLNYEKSIGLHDITGTPMPTPDATAFFSQDNTMLTLQRPVKYVSLRYNYSNPFEVLNNAQLQRGNFIADLPDETDPDGNTLTAKSFNTDCWLYERNVPPDVQDSVEYTKVLYTAGVETQRFIHMEAAANNDFYYLTSQQRIPVQFFDNFNIGCSIRYSTDLGGGSGHIQIHQIWVRLYADDGTFWNLHSVSGTGSSDPGTYWMQSDVTWGTNQRFCDFEGESENIDFTQWQSLTFNSVPCPRSGKLEILLINNQTASSQYKDFSSVNFDYIPYINGSYNIFASQSDTSTRDGVYYSSIEDEVFITNAPVPIFKGALLKPSGGDFVLVGKFYEGQQYDETTGPDHLATYGELRVRAYHNQFRNGDETYRATCQGLGNGVIDADGEDDHQDLIHRYFNRDTEPATLNQTFQLCNQDVDLRNCEWTGTLIKNFDIAIGFINDAYAFAYEATGSTGGGGGGVTGGGSSIFIVTADNGLHTDTPTNVRLGGTLVENTLIDSDGFDFTIQDSDGDGVGISPTAKTAFLQVAGPASAPLAAVQLFATSGSNVAVVLQVQDPGGSGFSASIIVDAITGRITLLNTGLISFDPNSFLIDVADNAAALGAGLLVGDIYRTGDFLKIVHV